MITKNFTNVYRPRKDFFFLDFSRGVAIQVGPGDAYKEAPHSGGGGATGRKTPVNPGGNAFKRPQNVPRPSGNALRPRNPQLGGHNNHRGYPQGGTDTGKPHITVMLSIGGKKMFSWDF